MGIFVYNPFVMKKGEKFNVKIEKLIAGGSGLCRINNFPVFVEESCPGDIVTVEIEKVLKSYAYGKIKEIIEPSDTRVKPFCPLHSVCGGCGLQHIKYEVQLEQKRNIVFETLKKITGEEYEINPVLSPENNKNYRHKIQYPVYEKSSGRIVAGYFKKNSHDIVNIKYCPVQPDFINDISEKIKSFSEDLKISGYNEKTGKGLLRHFIFRVSKTYSDTLVILVINDNKINEKIQKLCEKIYTLPKITGVCVNFNTKKTNVITGNITKCVCGKDFYEEEINGIKYNVSAGSFFQVNPYSASILFNEAKKMIEENIKNPSILDAYSGVSAFGLQMKNIAKEIICVEECESSFKDAQINKDLNKAENLQNINGKASEIFENFAREQRKFDVVLLDPPRKGCGYEALQHINNIAGNIIIYVSCNPSSLGSDINILKTFGFNVEKIQPVDMFCHTPHVENVVLLKRKGY